MITDQRTRRHPRPISGPRSSTTSSSRMALERARWGEVTMITGDIHDELVVAAGGGMAFRRTASDHIPVSVEVWLGPDGDSAVSIGGDESSVPGILPRTAERMRSTKRHERC